MSAAVSAVAAVAAVMSSGASSSLVTIDLCRRILNKLPGGVAFAFSYGSGAFRQTNNADARKNMLDFIVVVNNAEVWHSENLRVNRRHYSLLKYAGANVIADFQTHYGAGLYFNTLVKIDDRMIKYGVITTDKLLQDLLDWNTLYVSGRLHKPVLVIEKEKSIALDLALKTNLVSALHAACLLLPVQFSSADLYSTIAALSYRGDFRMTIGEDKNKIANIVLPNTERFDELYEPAIRDMKYLQRREGGFEQEVTNASCLYHLTNLPRTVHKMLVQDEYGRGRYRDVEEIMRELAGDLQLNTKVSGALANIVSNSSWSQSVKGVLTAGLTKSIRYSSSKLIKMLQSQKR